MANFLLYKYRFEKSKDRDLFSRSDGETLTEELWNDKLNAALLNAYETNRHRDDREVARHDLNLFSTKKNADGTSEPELFVNSIECSAGGITVMQVRNNKTKKVMPIDSNEAKKVGHYPFCWVIIDTRPGSQAILTEINADAFGNTGQVVELLETWVKTYFSLFEVEWTFETQLRVCVGKICDLVRARLKGGNDELSSLSIKFDGKKPNEKNGVGYLLQTLLTKFAAQDGELKLNTSKETQKLISDENAELVTILDLLIKYKYRVKVGFLKSGSIEYGKDARAVYGIDEKILFDYGVATAMCEDDMHTGYELEFLLDRIMPEDSTHKHIDRKRKRKARNNDSKRNAS